MVVEISPFRSLQASQMHNLGILHGKEFSRVVVQITRFVDPHNPGIMEAGLANAGGGVTAA